MNPLRAWSSFWFRTTSAGPLGLFRVAIGLIALVHLGLIANEADYWLSDQGIFQGTEARDLAGPLRPSPLQYIQDPLSVGMFIAATGFVGVLFTVGYQTRISAVLLYLGVLSIQQRNLPSHGGPDSLLLIFLFYLMLSPCGAAISIDAARRARKRGTLAEPLIVPWAQRLIQLQITLVYFDTAIMKVHGATWLDGTALHHVLTNGEFSRFPETWLPHYPILINLLTHSAVLVEFLLPALLWFRPTRVPMILVGILFHFGIFATMNVNLFSEMMIASYLTFLAPDEFQAFLKPFQPSRWLRFVKSRARPEGIRADPAEGFSGPSATATTSEAGCALSRIDLASVADSGD